MCVQVEYERYQPEVCVCLCTHPNESVFKYFCFKFGKDVKSVDKGVRGEDCVGGYVGVEDNMLPSAGSVSTSTMLSVPTVFTKNLACHLLEIRKYNNLESITGMLFVRYMLKYMCKKKNLQFYLQKAELGTSLSQPTATILP